MSVRLPFWPLPLLQISLGNLYSFHCFNASMHVPPKFDRAHIGLWRALLNSLTHLSICLGRAVSGSDQSGISECEVEARGCSCLAR